jgi:hypothetical protein
MEEESTIVAVWEENHEDFATKGQDCLVGKLIATRIIGKETIRSTII